MTRLPVSNMSFYQRYTATRFSSLLAITTVMSLLVLSGCADENRQKIVGSWTMIKADRLAQRVSADADAKSEKTEAEAKKTEATLADLPMMSLNFRNDGQLVTTTQLGSIDTEKIGRWKMIKFDPPETMTVECHFEENGKQSRQLEVKWIDEATIRLAPPNMSGQNMKLNFKRQ